MIERSTGRPRPQPRDADDGGVGGAVGGIRVGLYAAAVAVVVLGGLGGLAAAFQQPYLFPSVGPTVMVLAERPRSASAHPRNVLVGHLVAVAAGLLALLAFGLWHAQPAMHAGIGMTRIAAVVVSLAVTTLTLQLVRAPHPPAGATTLIVSLGLLRTPRDLVAIVTAIAFTALVATVINLATGRRRSLRRREPLRQPGTAGESIDGPRTFADRRRVAS